MLVEIYELLDPTTLASRYVGQSRNAKKRFSWHVSAARRGEPYRVYNWIRKVLRTDNLPVLSILEICLEQDANAREIFWISQRRKDGCNLTNGSDGGSGVRGRKHSDITKRKIGAKHKGKVLTPESRLRISLSKKGRCLTPEHREKLKSGSRHRPLSCLERKAISNRMKGNKLALGLKRSDSTLHKMHLAITGELSPKALLTNNQVLQIRRLAERGISQADLSRQFGVDGVCIHRVVRRKTYTDV